MRRIRIVVLIALSVTVGTRTTSAADEDSRLGPKRMADAINLIRPSITVGNVQSSLLLEGEAERLRQTRTSRGHSPWFPVKVGAIIGCSAGAILGFMAYPYIADSSDTGQRLKLTAGSCIGTGTFGAAIGYAIATR